MALEESIFRWLHLSDLHFKSEGLTMSFDRAKLKAKINEITNGLSINCLIITGDVFHKGCLNTKLKTDLTRFITALPGADCGIAICPGNHDLDRCARKRIADCPDYQYRSDVISDIYKSLPSDTSNALQVSDGNIDIIYKEPFADYFDYFDSISNKMGVPIANPRKPYGVETNNYEVCVYEFTHPSLLLPIRIISLNTALLAGRAIKGDELLRILKQRKEEFDAAEQKHNFSDAAKIYFEYSRYMNDALMYGYAIDDKDLYVLTKHGEESIDKLMSNTKPAITVLIGHHGVDLMSTTSKTHVRNLVSNYVNSGIYLCGHAHQPAYTNHKIDNHSSIHEFTAGGAFYDKTGYTRYGFDIGEIKQAAQGKVDITVTSHFGIRKPSNDIGWDKETEHISVYIDTLANSAKNASPAKLIENESSIPDSPNLIESYDKTEKTIQIDIGKVNQKSNMQGPNIVRIDF